MSYIILRGRWCHIIVLNVHAPTEEKAEDVKDSFYVELERVFEKFPKYTTPKLEDHPLSFIRGCLFNIFVAILHSWRPSLQPQPVRVHGSRPLSFQNIYEDLTAHMLRIRRNSQ
jgi:hypothetical protein